MEHWRGCNHTISIIFNNANSGTIAYQNYDMTAWLDVLCISHCFCRFLANPLQLLELVVALSGAARPAYGTRWWAHEEDAARLLVRLHGYSRSSVAQRHVHGAMIGSILFGMPQVPDGWRFARLRFFECAHAAAIPMLWADFEKCLKCHSLPTLPPAAR